MLRRGELIKRNTKRSLGLVKLLSLLGHSCALGCAWTKTSSLYVYISRFNITRAPANMGAHPGYPVSKYTAYSIVWYPIGIPDVAPRLLHESSYDNIRHHRFRRQPCSWRAGIAASCCLTGRKGPVSRPSLKAPKGIWSAHKIATSAPSETRTQLAGLYFVISTSVATPLTFLSPQNNTAIYTN